MQLSTGEKIYKVVNNILLFIVALVMLYPFIYVLAVSLSDVVAVSQGRVWLFPIGFNLSAYERIFSQPILWVAYGNSLFILVVGTLLSVFLTILAAYPLSKKRLRGRTFFTFIIALTLWIKVPMIPFYLNMQNLHLDNSLIGYIVAFAISAFYVVILKTYFQSIPESLEESAKLDGASDFQILWRIMAPLAVPSILTIALYYAVDKWNGYFWAMTLLKDERFTTLQVYLKKLVVEMNVTEEMNALGDLGNIIPETFIYATIVVAVIPMMIIYPFVQKFLIKGMMVGAVKG